MKQEIKQNLEKIINFIKAPYNVVKEHPKEIILLVSTISGVYALNKLASKANAAEMQVNNVNYTGIPPYNYDYVSNPVLYLITGDSFFERYVLGEDWDWLLGPNPIPGKPASPNLTIHTQEPNDANKMATSKKPYHNNGWEVYLGVKGSIAGPIINDIEATVSDATGLDHRKVIAYDKTSPGTVQDIDKTPGVWTIISLPDVVNRQDEIYAIWMFATPPNLPGDSAGPNEAGKFEIGKLDGQNDYFDIKTITSQWLQATDPNQNYLEGDLNFDRIVNFEDFAIPAGYWWKTEDGNSISKLTPPIDRIDLEEALNLATHLYGNKAQKNKPTLIFIAYQNNQTPNQSLSPDITERLLARKEDVQPSPLEDQIQTINDNHKPLSRNYETIDQKLNNHKAFLAS
ncbi:MAG: hypothetical protein ACYSQZ_05900 [Planctomycetota bacterium]|jgi:hypothetical protein